MASLPRDSSELPIEYRRIRYVLPSPRPPLPGRSDLSVREFQAVMTRLRRHNAKSLRIFSHVDDPIDETLVLCRSSSICGLAQYVFQTLAEYELHVKSSAKDMSQHKITEAMAEERRIKVPTMKNSHVSSSRAIVELILRFFALGPRLSSFSQPTDSTDPTPWAIIIILLVFLGT